MECSGRIVGGLDQRIHDFAGGNDGRKPIDNVILLGNTLYGMTVFGGSFGQGTIFAVPLP